MAFSNSAVHVGELGGALRGKVASAVGTQLSANITTISAIGGNEALARAVVAFVDAWRTANVQAGQKLSANALVSVAASSTSSLVTLQFQVIPTA